jgi:3-dehydrosphinganine reductase
MDLNYFGTLKLLQPIAKKMALRRQGHIVVVASVLSFMTITGYAGYSASKFALKGLCDSIKYELAAYNVKIHVLAPGTVLTPGLEEENKRKP